ncbi:MAG: helix-turn-helix transcriptional regulator [Clostridia bacterium]|nr:helix-turn-helix transcriptional regulator [Clostridia bacterium]
MNLNIGENIKMLRKEHSVSQNELAEYLAVKPQSVSKWERGVCEPDIALLPEIALFFGVSIDELFSPEKIKSSDEALLILKKLYCDKKWREMYENALIYAREFPGEAKICEKLLNALIHVEMCGERIEEKDITFAVNLAKRVLNKCNDALLKQRITYHLCVILYEKGRKEEADFYYSDLNCASYGRESLDMYKYRGHELVKKLKENNAIWYNMLAMNFSRIAYNIDVGEESLCYLRKSYEFFYAAYECVESRGYLRMCLLSLLDIAVTYEMMERGTEAAKSFAEARNFAIKQEIKEDFDDIVKKALVSNNLCRAARHLYERMCEKNV